MTRDRTKTDFLKNIGSRMLKALEARIFIVLSPIAINDQFTVVKILPRSMDLDHRTPNLNKPRLVWGGG